MGLDKISARMLKETVSSITPMITAIFNMSLSTGIATCPDSWKSSLIVPVPKSGDSSNPWNYRPISLLPIVSKLLEKHICDLLCELLDISAWPTVGISGLQASLPPMPSYQPLMNGLSTLRMGQKCRLYSLTSRRHSIVSPIVFWSTKSTNWRSLAT